MFHANWKSLTNERTDSQTYQKIFSATFLILLLTFSDKIFFLLTHLD